MSDSKTTYIVPDQNNNDWLAASMMNAEVDAVIIWKMNADLDITNYENFIRYLGRYSERNETLFI